MNKVWFIGAFALLIFIVPAHAGEEMQQMKNTAVDIATTSVKNELNADGGSIPGWLKRTSVQFQFERNYNPTYQIETVQPLFQLDDDDMFFIQANARRRDSNNTFNLGLGYRNIVWDEVMLGVNSFYDYSSKYKYKRLGFGLEAIGTQFEARANSYHRIERKKEIRTGVDGEVLNGFDVELGGRLIPFSVFDDLRMFGSYNVFYARENADDFEQYVFRATHPVGDYFDLEMRYTHDVKKYDTNIDQNRFFIEISLNLDKPVKYSPDLREKLLQPVERIHEIIVEETSAFSVSIKRGT